MDVHPHSWTLVSLCVKFAREQATMFAQVDRLFKQAIVDKDPFTVSCALVSGIQLFNLAPDVIRRWVNEVQESVTNKTKMTQYHALNLLHLIRRHDKLAINKVVCAWRQQHHRKINV